MGAEWTGNERIGLRGSDGANGTPTAGASPAGLIAGPDWTGGHWIGWQAIG